jgi:hypothetical protein
MDQQKANITDRFGQEMWDEHFQGALSETLGNLPLELQASKPHVESAVQAIYGRVHLQDPTALDTKRQEIAEARREPPPLLEGGRPRPTGNTITPAEKDFLAALDRNGLGFGEKDYLEARAKGNTEADWKVERNA